jgi:hypothetical protein
MKFSFLKEGKYAVDILCRFFMLDCKSMSTSMVSNLNKLHKSDSESELVDPSMYKQLIGSLRYLIHTRPNICFVVSALNQSMSESRHKHWIDA